jgi:hypothetical protein
MDISSALLVDSTLDSHPRFREGEFEVEVDLEPAELFEFRQAWKHTWVVVPPVEDPEAPALARRLRDLAAWTGWSNRRLAELLGTSHPTIAAARRGRETTRVPELADRIAGLHRVVERVAVLCDRDVSEVIRLIETRPPGGVSAATHIEMGELSKAYLAVLDARAPGSLGLMGSSLPPRRPGTVAIEDLSE